MKKLILSLLAIPFAAGTATAQAVIDDVTYAVDTISQTHEGPGIVFTQVRLDEFPLNVYLLEMDLTNEYNRVETTQAYDTLGRQETLTDAYTRQKAKGKKPIAACNANFWVVTGSGEPWTNYMLGFPFGAVVVNDTTYVNTNTTTDTWNGGPYYTGSVAIDHDKTLSIGRHLWSGQASSAKFSSPVEIIQVNKCCYSGEVALFSRPFGRDRTISAPDSSSYVYLNLKQGSSWAVNADMTFTVQEIVTDTTGLTLGNCEAVLVAQGDAQTQFAALSAGDEITINQGWATIDGETAYPSIENMVEGNAPVMWQGELTERNYNETYNTQVYSKTAYGCDSTGKKLFMIVIDKSTSDYGTSAGCTTAQMCQLWKSLCPDLWNAVNLDAGGSAMMMLNGSVVSTTSEGTPRAVATGWMLFSTAPDDDTEIASLRFESPHLQMPVLSSFSPTVMGYNKYGEVVDRDVDVTYEIDAAIGTSEGSVIVAGSEPGIGVITAKYGNSISVEAPITILDAEIALRIKPTILIDGTREYPMEVVSTIGNQTYTYDPTRISWTVSDNSVASITGGTLRGLSNGEATVTCELGGFTDTTTVKVEIADAPTINVEWTDWTLKGSGSNMSLSEDGVLSMTYSGGRAAYISLVKDVEFYSLPDKIWIDFTSTIPMQYLQVDFRSGEMTASNYTYFGKDDGGYEAGTRYAFELPITELGDTADLATYPISIHDIRFTPATSGYTSGENSITFHGLYGEYSHYTSGVSPATADNGTVSIYPNPTADGSFSLALGNDLPAQVAVYTPSGATVYTTSVQPSAGVATVETRLPRGLYFVTATTATAAYTAKLMIK